MSSNLDNIHDIQSKGQLTSKMPVRQPNCHLIHSQYYNQEIIRLIIIFIYVDKIQLIGK